MTPLSLARAVSTPRFPVRVLTTSALLFLLLPGCTKSTGTVHRYPAGGTASVERVYVPPAPVAPGVPSGTATLPKAETTLARGDSLEAASQYQQAASSATPALAADYRLRAAEAANQGNDPVRADLILDQIPANPLDGRQQFRYRLLRAQTALLRNDPVRALRLLPSSEPSGDPVMVASLLQIRAASLAKTGDIVGSAQAYVQRERYLAGKGAIAENRDALWAALGGATFDNATLARAQTMPPVVRGWIDLAVLARRSASLQDYDTWRRQYPGHPGEERLASLYVPAPSERSGSTIGATTGIPITSGPSAGSFTPLASSGGGIALVLPRSGPLQSIGESVRAGYSHAASAAGAGGEARIYDSTPGAATAYQQAASEGAGAVVGPLRREDAAALAQSGSLAVPVLALNYLDAGKAAPAGFYQFGLAPEDEAREAATDAHARGLTRALVMTPSSDWGNRIAAAFSQRMQDLGGRVVDSGHYSGDPQNWSDPIRALLRYAPIKDKAQAASARARAGGADPQRRNDFDFVFIAGKASQARVLWPLFRYYHADRLPIYATAAVFEGDGDSDLSGIRFCDAPWVLGGGGQWSALASEARTGRNLDGARLYAMGNDAQLLASRIAQNQLHPGDTVAGATGMLTVDNGGAIRRGLVCAQMTSGQPNLLSTAGSFNSP